jgi:hypothetical protein
LDLNSNTEVAGVKVRKERINGSDFIYAFIATTDTTPANGGGPFLVYDLSIPGTPVLISTCPLNYSEKAAGLDFRDNLGFIANESNDAFAIIHPTNLCPAP